MATITEAPSDATINAEPTPAEAETSQKRKASPKPDAGEGFSKRIKTGDDDHDENERHRDPQPTSPADLRKRSDHVEEDAGENENSTSRRRSSSGGGTLSKEEEKKRGKRLFGGLLSTLSQTNNSSQVRKRREIEQRHQERAQKQRAEDEKRRVEKLAKVTEARWLEQIKLDEKVMKTRHANLLARAHSLRTRAEPTIYYRPWKLTRDQEDTVNDQIQEAKAVIRREVEAFNDQKEEHERRHGRSRPPTRHEQQSAPAAVAVAAESLADMPPSVPKSPPADAFADGTDAIPSHDRDEEDREPHDESGDVVEDAEEDMVIY